MIGLDIYTWQKLIRLKNEGWKDLIIEILKEGNFFITHEVKKEFYHFFPHETTLLEFVEILPILNQIINEYLQKNFDLADASLLEYSDIKNYRICTEDRPMLMEGVTSKRKIIQLADLFGELYVFNFLSKKELYQLTKTLKKWRNISNKKEKQVKTLMA